MVDEDAREIHEVGCCRGCGESRESRLGPELAADRGEGVGEGGEGRALPSRSAKRGDGRELVMGEEGHACGQAEQGRCRTGDRALGPRALGRDAEGRADLAQRHFALPAQDKPGDELQRIGGQIGAQQGGCGELVARIADEHPANRDGRQAGVVPDRGARKPWEGSVARAVAARDGWGRPGRRGVVDVGRRRRSCGGGAGRPPGAVCLFAVDVEVGQARTAGHPDAGARRRLPLRAPR